MRDNAYLRRKLEQLWQAHFPDVQKTNTVEIEFGKKAVKRLGSIRRCHYPGQEGFDTLIYLNGHFRDEAIPEYVIDATICHELAHYAHGFSSPLPKLSRFPHRGGVVDRELETRGLGKLLRLETEWLKTNWMNYLEKKTA